MARSFRYYGKKRGNRRTGSPAWGNVGEGVFCAVLLLLGCGGAIWMFSQFVVPEWRVNHEFVETTCKVLEKRVREMPTEDGVVFRPELKIEYPAGGDISTWTQYDIHKASYSNREDAQAVLSQFNVYAPNRNNRYPCWYDPADPYVVVLVREGRWWVWLAFTVPASFVVIGAGGLIYSLLRWGRSAEQRAAMTQRVQERDFLGRGRRVYPSVPRGADMTNSPGTRLRFRLPMATSPGWALFGTFAFCLIWNGLVSVFLVIAIRSHVAGEPDWFLTIFIIPFALIGLGAIVVLFRQLLVTTGIGPTLVEISNHPLAPGQRYRLFLSQSGRLTINSMRVSLVCEETATYRQGTDTRTETQEVYRQELLRREGFDIQSGLPFEAELELDVPAEAMHSFKAAHNEIGWSLAVEGDVLGWPDYKRSFSVVVCTANGDAGR